MVVRDTPTPTVDVAYEQKPSVPDDESTTSAQVAIAQVVAPVTSGPGEVEKAANEVRFYAPEDASAPAAPEVRCLSYSHRVALQRFSYVLAIHDGPLGPSFNRESTSSGHAWTM
jgi:hypothetical protein